MLNALRALPEFLFPAYSLSTVDSQPQAVDLDQEFDRYSFYLDHPDKQDAINQLFDQTIIRSSGEAISLRDFLESNIYNDEDGKSFESIGFRQLKRAPEYGIVLEHDSFPGWLIKKNYGYTTDEDLDKTYIQKGVGAKNIPRWMFPPEMRARPYDIDLGIQVPNDGINPLRAVMLERGRHWINALHLQHVVAARDYLVSLASYPPHTPKPLHERVVVISQKEPILDEHDNILRFVQLAHSHPDKLRKIASEICLFISCNPLTDLHLNNLRFLNDSTHRIVFIDGEPIGALTNTSDTQTLQVIQEYDRGFFPILGLRKLQQSISEKMKDEDIPQASIDIIQKIFDAAIEKRVQVITWERHWQWYKTSAFEHVPTLSSILSIFSKMRDYFLSWKQFFQIPQEEKREFVLSSTGE